MIFAWFFIDPQLPFYVFDELGWSTAQFGSAISFYGWATLVGSLALSQSSDGRFLKIGSWLLNPLYKVWSLAHQRCVN